MKKLIMVIFILMMSTSSHAQVDCPTKCEPDCCELVPDASGGTGTITYLWSDNSTAATLDACSTSVYAVTVTDANGCTAMQEFNVTVDNPPNPTCQSRYRDENNIWTWVQQGTNNVPPCENIPICCNGQYDVQMWGHVGAPTSTHTYLWSTGITSSVLSISNIDCSTTPLPLNYSVTVTETATGCTSVLAYTIVEGNNCPCDMEPTCVATSVSCNGGSDGSIAVTPNGTPPYTYSWTGAATGNPATGLLPGIYIVTVTDDNGCTGSTTCAVTEPPAISVSPVCQ